MKIFTQPGCPSCAKVKVLIERIKPDFPNLKVKTIDIISNPDYIDKYSIMSTPTIVINDRVEFRGVPEEKALRNRIKELQRQTKRFKP